MKNLHHTTLIPEFVGFSEYKLLKIGQFPSSDLTCSFFIAGISQSFP